MTPANATESVETLRVDLGPRSYDIVVGSDLLDRAGDWMGAMLPQNRVFIVTDDNVAPLYLARLETACTNAGIAPTSFILPAGEMTKSFDHLQDLINRMLNAGIERKTTVVALGGGVIGDLAGFAASIGLRGVPFLQIPTTLLSQVDSSVGGKTGINVPHGKNLVGAFYQPLLVLADMAVLDTLPRRELLAGYAEIAKYGMIDNPDFFGWLENNGSALIAGDRACRRHAVMQACAAKADLVARDEREMGQRALLNLGHTFGHALEAETGYGGALLHGEAVAIGMIQAFGIAAEMGLCPDADVARARRHLADVGLAVDLTGLDTTGWTAERLIAHMHRDKKVEDGTIMFVLARGLGQAFLTKDVPVDRLRTFLAAALAEATS